MPGLNKVKKTSSTIESITDFLFIGCVEDLLIRGQKLVIVLGNQYIDGTVDIVKRFYDEGIIVKDAIIILSGATGSLNAGQELECRAMYKSAVERLGMDPALFVQESRATNALENLMFSKDIIDAHGGFERFPGILCIGKAFLGRRAFMGAEKLGYPMEKMQYYGTVDREGLNIGPDCWWKSPEAAARVFAELERIGKYSLDGSLWP